MAQHLLIQLKAPLIAFGGEAIDNLGVIRDFPALSMVTGLLANALGWDRSDHARHDRLQQRLRLGARIHTSGTQLTDFQTAQLDGNDLGWTTRGTPEGRAGGSGTYAGPHLRYRDYHADMDVVLALRLEPADEVPLLTDLAVALDKPARPLFVGRKCCLPTSRLMAGWVDAHNILEALERHAPVEHVTRIQWPVGEGIHPHAHPADVCDERQWASGVHSGWRPVLEGVLHPQSTKELA